jgi:hypothetical protein
MSQGKCYLAVVPRAMMASYRVVMGDGSKPPSRPSVSCHGFEEFVDGRNRIRLTNGFRRFDIRMFGTRRLVGVLGNNEPAGITRRQPVSPEFWPGCTRPSDSLAGGGTSADNWHQRTQCYSNHVKLAFSSGSFRSPSLISLKYLSSFCRTASFG